jgi:hypothetical protein
MRPWLFLKVLSKSNTKADQVWRQGAYASVPNCQHCVTVSLKTVEVITYDRASGWKGRSSTTLEAALPLPALGLSIPVADIYRWTPPGGQ